MYSTDADTLQGIEFDRRQSKQLPIFEMDSEVQDEVISFLNSQATSIPSNSHISDVSSLLDHIAPSSAASDLLMKALVTHALLLRLGFTSKQAILALSSCQSVADIDECVAWLAGNLTSLELEAAERKVEGKPPLKSQSNGSRRDEGEVDEDEEDEEDAVDTTQPPDHEGLTFERHVSTKPATRNQSSMQSTPATTTPVELSPEMERQISQSVDMANALTRILDDREVIDALERPVESYANAKLYTIQAEKASAVLERAAKGIGEGSSANLDMARRKLRAVKTQARSVIDECQESRDWNRATADRLFLKRKLEWEDQEAESGNQVKENGEVAEVAAQPNPANGKEDNISVDMEDRSEASSDEDGMFGDMLDEQAREVTDSSTQAVVRLRELPPQTIKAGGSKSPKVLLSDALRRVDPYATSRFEIVATGGKMFRSRLTLRWSAKAESSVVDTYTMTKMATGTQSSADDILAVAALMCIENRPVYKTLASGWRDWWNELESKRQEQVDAKSRALFKRLLAALGQRLLEENVKAEEKSRRLKATQYKSGGAEESKLQTPSSAAVVPPVQLGRDERAASMWEARRSSAGYLRLEIYHYYLASTVEEPIL